MVKHHEERQQGRNMRLLRGLREDVRFVKNWASNPLTTGAVSPSGKALAKNMAMPVDPNDTRPVIELGPGTGSVTKALLQHGVKPQRLFAVEYNPEFCTFLRERFEGCTFIQGDAYNIRSTLDAAGVLEASTFVSSLPLFTRPMADRCHLLNEALDILPEGGEFVQFSYALVPPVRAKDLDVECTLDVGRWIVLNVPPARVWRYKRKTSK